MKKIIKNYNKIFFYFILLLTIIILLNPYINISQVKGKEKFNDSFINNVSLTTSIILPDDSYSLSSYVVSDNIEVFLSDGLTNNNLDETRNEIPPGVTLYRFQNKHPFFKYFFAEKVKGVEIQFYINYYDNDWIRIYNEFLYTNENGKAYLPSLREFIPKEIMEMAPIDIQLKAIARMSDGSEVFDDKGLIRILDKSSENNPFILTVDHDNTLHATGGLNSIFDMIYFLNWAKDDWPLVDTYVKDVIPSLHNNNTDIIIVTGLPNPIRALCRDQVNIHFEDGGKRFIPMFIKSDFTYEHSNEFKAATLGIIKMLYGMDNFIAMVGDTVRQDGYGAYTNKLRYIPFQIHYMWNIDLLDTEGYGYIDPELIADNWSDVMDYIKEGDTVTNFFLRNENSFLNIAHRGGGDLRPENTLLSYRYALEVGAEVLEGDLHSTKDGVIVVSHDSTVDRCTDGSGMINDYFFNELRGLDAGYWFTTDDGETYPYRGYSFNGVDHLQIPTLEEVFSDNVINKSPMILEIKQQQPSIVDGVLDFIDEYEMEDRVIIGSFNRVSLDEIREKSKMRGINIVTSFCEEEVLDFYLTPLLSIILHKYISPGYALQVPIEYELSGINVPVVTSFFMNKARHLGLKVHVWTVNDPDKMRWLINDVGVDGIMSDNPELLEEIIHE
jgi:glycerophosphoryl diester phosphodiesterase